MRKTIYRHYNLYQCMENRTADSKFNNLFLHITGRLKKVRNRKTGMFDCIIKDEIALHDKMVDDLNTKISDMLEIGWTPAGKVLTSSNKNSSW